MPELTSPAVELQQKIHARTAVVGTGGGTPSGVFLLQRDGA